jgi:hypothetical protein
MFGKKKNKFLFEHPHNLCVNTHNPPVRADVGQKMR